MKGDLGNKNSILIYKIIENANKILDDANVPISGIEKVEISCHYGIENFAACGALIIDKINREYCKKLIVMMSNQKHPTHYHIKKEEAFELLHGDCELVLNDNIIELKKGKPVLIPRGVRHSFSSKSGCVIEEVSTTHHTGDSIYDDPNINSLKITERKIKVKLRK
jgi:N-acetylneuraminate synthase